MKMALLVCLHAGVAFTALAVEPTVFQMGRRPDPYTRVGMSIGTGKTSMEVFDMKLKSGRALGNVVVVAVEESLIKIVPQSKTNAIPQTVMRSQLTPALAKRFAYHPPKKE